MKRALDAKGATNQETAQPVQIGEQYALVSSARWTSMGSKSFPGRLQVNPRGRQKTGLINDESAFVFFFSKPSQLFTNEEV